MHQHKKATTKLNLNLGTPRSRAWLEREPGPNSHRRACKVLAMSVQAIPAEDIWAKYSRQGQNCGMHLLGVRYICHNRNLHQNLLHIKYQGDIADHRARLQTAQRKPEHRSPGVFAPFPEKHLPLPHGWNADELYPDQRPRTFSALLLLAASLRHLPMHCCTESAGQSAQKERTGNLVTPGQHASGIVQRCEAASHHSIVIAWKRRLKKVGHFHRHPPMLDAVVDWGYPNVNRVYFLTRVWPKAQPSLLQFFQPCSPTFECIGIAIVHCLSARKRMLHCSVLTRHASMIVYVSRVRNDSPQQVASQFVEPNRVVQAASAACGQALFAHPRRGTSTQLRDPMLPSCVFEPPRVAFLLAPLLCARKPSKH